ncbi:hypothetical protein [Paramaledivibacter caminithermalis]|uniref:hypothetical protein n=1 Tax=Paramaledivibacter caminithermalis TaxID=191027 RepID=UPI0009351340|nr:hypothetical protein [Paramaledivibacter caminithermalis]
MKKYLEYILEEDVEVVEKRSYGLVSQEVKNDTYIEKTENKSMDEIINEIEKSYNIDIERLKGRSENRYISKVKKYFIKEVIKNELMSQKELAEYLRVTEMAVSKIANKV